ncbi:MAG TPA: hypothetical protein P5230_02435 [Candidatus Magasanikbacteria bacterium]|nr:hypothetical protein [Candidatus Magasanikbacteria bacterium]
MLFNNSIFVPGDDDANYDENDAVWQEEEKDELDEFGFKTEGEEEEEVEKETKEEGEESDEEEEDEDEDEEGFGIEKDV